MSERRTDRTTVAVMQWHGYRPRRTGEQCNGCGPFCGAYVRTDREDSGGGVICDGCDDETSG